jgi:predicted nucleic acid-binding protein
MPSIQIKDVPEQTHAIAAYVALAEAMSTTLLTGDQRLARAPGPQCPVEIFQPAP